MREASPGRVTCHASSGTDRPHFGAERPGGGHGGVLFGGRADLEELDQGGQGGTAELRLNPPAPRLDIAGVDRRRAGGQEVGDVLDVHRFGLGRPLLGGAHGLTPSA
jgi:hypothetical protein